MNSQRVLIYGAAGHTGQLIAREATKRGLDVVLAGRPSHRLEQLAHRLRVPWRAAEATEKTVNDLHAIFRDAGVVVNAAGPFAQTGDWVMQACLGARCHY